MMAGPEAIACFIETGEAAILADTFADDGVVIFENFAPFLFAGPGAVGRWTAAMTEHLAASAELKHSFGPARDFAVAGEAAYFSLPTHWRGLVGERPFSESGGWAFGLVRIGDQWRVKTYAWAVTELALDGDP
jgi:hypothetical protein